MGVLTIAGVTYTMVLDSDLKRDGMFLDRLQDSPDGSCLAEVFYSDQTHTMAFTAFRKDLPLEAVELIIEHAKVRLPPLERG